MIPAVYQVSHRAARRFLRQNRRRCQLATVLAFLVVFVGGLTLLGDDYAEYNLLDSTKRAVFGARSFSPKFKYPAKAWNNLGGPKADLMPDKSASDGLRDLLNMVNKNKDSTDFVVNQIPEYRVVHLDFKGARPKLSYLKKTFPLMKQAGANALLVEYEDSFPFSGKLANLSAKNAMSEQEMIDFVTLATAENDFEIIPLIQTFGHLEYALKLEEFAHLREVGNEPQELCPSKSFDFVTEVISQVMNFHPDAKFVHIGCDEVVNLGKCGQCLAKMEEGQGKGVSLKSRAAGEMKLYLDHVKEVANHVRDKYDIQPLIWDDMLRKMPAKTLINSGIADLIEPVVWVYSPDFQREFPNHLWPLYAKVFPRIWGASAFKGAFGPAEYAPNVYKHVLNNLAWQRMIANEDKFFKSIPGLVFTGWQRYDHFATLCELLPNSMPSLLLNLFLVSRGSTSLSEATSAFHELLSCPGLVVIPQNLQELEENTRLWHLRKCNFPGADVVELLWNYQGVKLESESWVKSVAVEGNGEGAAWLSDYNMKYNSTTARRASQILVYLPQVRRKIAALEEDGRKTLSKYFDEFTVDEWIEQRVLPLERKVEDIQRRGNFALRVSEWRRRPFVT